MLTSHSTRAPVRNSVAMRAPLAAEKRACVIFFFSSLSSFVPYSACCRHICKRTYLNSPGTRFCTSTDTLFELKATGAFGRAPCNGRRTGSRVRIRSGTFEKQRKKAHCIRKISHHLQKKKNTLLGNSVTNQLARQKESSCTRDHTEPHRWRALTQLVIP